MSYRLLQNIRNALTQGFRTRGVGFPFIAAVIACKYLSRKVSNEKHFVLGEGRFRYEIHPFILNNERAVEIGLARELLGRREAGAVLEVGNVLSAYMTFPHDVVDKYEKAAGVINEDIIAYRPGRTYDVIISLSTLEHVGWDEVPKEPEKIEKAINWLKELLSDGGELLVTMPLGYNSYLDGLLRNKQIGLPDVRFMKRMDKRNRWKEVQFQEVASARYGAPFECGNAILIGRYIRQSPKR